MRLPGFLATVSYLFDRFAETRHAAIETGALAASEADYPEVPAGRACDSFPQAGVSESEAGLLASIKSKQERGVGAGPGDGESFGDARHLRTAPSGTLDSTRYRTAPS